MALFTAIAILAAPDVYALDMSQSDKQAHAGLSFDMAAAGVHSFRQMGYSNLGARLASGSLVLILGAAKEYLSDTHSDVQDIQANAVGVSLGLMIPFKIEF